MKKFPMTPKGLAKLKAEHRACKAERPKLGEIILAARELGDISENAEFHAAKEKQGFLEGRIIELEAKISLAEVIDPTKLKGDKVVFGANVAMEDIDSGDVLKYTIVGEDESDVKQGLISIASPLARALLGHFVGDEVTLRVPGGSRAVEITDISFG